MSSYTYVNFLTGCACCAVPCHPLPRPLHTGPTYVEMALMTCTMCLPTTGMAATTRSCSASPTTRSALWPGVLKAQLCLGVGRGRFVLW